MAPELVTGNGTPGKAADIYALGGILYAILTLDSPLAGLPQQEVLRRTASGRIAPPSLSGRQFPPGLEAICLKAMALDPEDRYQSAMDMRSDINASLSGYAAIAEDASVIRNFALFLRRNIYPVIIFILSVATGILAYWAWHLYKN